MTNFNCLLHLLQCLDGFKSHSLVTSRGYLTLFSLATRKGERQLEEILSSMLKLLMEQQVSFLRASILSREIV